MNAKEKVISLPPVRFWGLDPLFCTHIKMFVKDVHDLQECADYRGVYCYANTHPVTKVEILGHIVSIDEKEKLTSFGVDDGSGTIVCCQWHATSDLKDCSDSKELYQLGQLVTVQGKISEFREKRQLTVDLIYAESDPNVEVLFWLEAVDLGNNVYSHNQSFTHFLENPPAGTDEMTKEEELKKAILQQIKENKIVAFQFNTLCLDPDIQQIASEAVRQKSTDQEPQGKKLDRSYEIKKVVRQVIKDLERSGLVYFKDSRTDLYEVISHERNLGSAIKKAMRKISARSGSPVSKWAIMDMLHSSHKFQHVTLHQIEDSLDKFLQSSDIYRHSEHQYFLV